VATKLDVLNALTIICAPTASPAAGDLSIPVGGVRRVAPRPHRRSSLPVCPATSFSPQIEREIPDSSRDTTIAVQTLAAILSGGIQ